MGKAIISGPTVLKDRGIVFVTINYRMGAFGFLATGSEEALGLILPFISPLACP